MFHQKVLFIIRKGLATMESLPSRWLRRSERRNGNGESPESEKGGDLGLGRCAQETRCKAAARQACNMYLPNKLFFGVVVL